MRHDTQTCSCGRAMRFEVRVPGVAEPGRFFAFYSCACGRVDCAPDEAGPRVAEARWPEAS